MNKEAKIKNIIAFLSIIFSEDSLILSELMEKSPTYLLEKYERYVLSERDESPWGMHPIVRNGVFNHYCEKWHIRIEIEEKYE